MFTVIGDNTIWKKLSYDEVKLKEAFFRGLQLDYVIVYPDGHKITCKNH